MNRTIQTLTLLVIVALVAILQGCATARTKWSDPAYRVAVDAESIGPVTYANLVHSLKRSGAFIVLDRAQGAKAVAEEQDRQYNTETTEAFDPKERYALIGKLQGVGAIVVPAMNCERYLAAFGGIKNDCQQMLVVVNAQTSEIIATGRGEAISHGDITPDWDESVESLVRDMPKHYESDRSTDELKAVREVAGKTSVIQNKESE